LKLSKKDYSEPRIVMSTNMGVRGFIKFQGSIS
jgi:hypothetical protein